MDKYTPELKLLETIEEIALILQSPFLVVHFHHIFLRKQDSSCADGLTVHLSLGKPFHVILSYLSVYLVIRRFVFLPPKNVSLDFQKLMSSDSRKQHLVTKLSMNKLHTKDSQ